MGDGSMGMRKDNIFKPSRILKRLKTDHIDLYQSHTDDEETPLGETLSAYDTLIKQGKVRAIGASNYTAARLRQALDEVSVAHGVPLAAIALAWLIQRPAITAPIASAAIVVQLADLVKAATVILSTGNVVRLDQASAIG